jgi:hypothetical protein
LTGFFEARALKGNALEVRIEDAVHAFEVGNHVDLLAGGAIGAKANRGCQEN